MTEPTILTAEMAHCWIDSPCKPPEECYDAFCDAMDAIFRGRTLVITAEQAALDAEDWALLWEAYQGQHGEWLFGEEWDVRFRALIAKREALK